MDQQQLFVQMALLSWNTQLKRAEKVFNSYSKDEFYLPVAPGKNRIVYLYGHLAAYHDMLKETLGIGKQNRPDLAVIFLQSPDNHSTEFPSIEELKAYWAEVHDELNTLFDQFSAADWFKRHNAMTDEDFEKDPSRNRLSVLLNRANHVAYHVGQVALVKPANA
ncbi:MAG: hypothetical protein JWR12_1701 [Mucilaginibacter sp.]|nr:hypothetical protein [Mucilaginibacter sp.]